MPRRPSGDHTTDRRSPDSWREHTENMSLDSFPAVAELGLGHGVRTIRADRIYANVESVDVLAETFLVEAAKP